MPSDAVAMSSSPRVSMESATARPHVRQRASSYRKTLAAASDGDEMMTTLLETLDQKRKQLDDQIHKYVAQKEREYKQYEKELKDQYERYRQQDTDDHMRKVSFNSTGSSNSCTIDRKPQSAADIQRTAGSRRGGGSPLLEARDIDDLARAESEHKQAFAGLKDRRESTERERDLLDLFMPQYLPSLDHKGEEGKPTRVLSAPALVETSTFSDTVVPVPAEALQRNNTDPTVKPQTRPSRLKLGQRTSSFGSSVDGKGSLVSAMRSPALGGRLREPKRKRVSLAVGDEIVKPSDHVPDGINLHNYAPSHSRTRSPVPEHKVAPGAGFGSSAHSNHSAQQELNLDPHPETSSHIAEGAIENDDKSDHAASVPAEVHTGSPSSSAISATQNIEPTNFPDPAGAPPRGPRNWHSDRMSLNTDVSHAADDETESPFDMEEDFIPFEQRKFSQRRDVRSPPPSPSPPVSPTDVGSPREGSPRLVEGQERVADPGEGERQRGSNTESIWGFTPQSLPTSAQQPTSPGFARPSVRKDPMFSADFIAGPEMREDQALVYTPFDNPSGRFASMTAGSLGESYMQRHAQETLRQRMSGGAP